MKDIHEQTYYELLEIDRGASSEEILKAYNRARAIYGNNSPALYSLFNREEAQELLKLIDEAYAILSNQFKRKQYDDQQAGVIGRIEESERKPVRPSDILAIPSAADLDMVSQATQTIPTPPPAPPEAAQAHDFRPLSYSVDDKLEQEIVNADEFTGELLKRIRIYKNITLDQVSERTRISRSYLNALESENYASLPAPVFVRGFLVQVAKMLSLNSAKVVNTYMRRMKERKS